MAWCRQATSHYLRQCWLRSLSPYVVARPQWVKAFANLRHWYDSFSESFLSHCTTDTKMDKSMKMSQPGKWENEWLSLIAFWGQRINRQVAWNIAAWRRIDALVDWVIIGSGIGLLLNSWQPITWTNADLTHWGLVTSYGVQAITWSNVDLSSVRSCGIHLRAIL